MIRRYFQEPPIVSTPLDDVWSVIVPVARTNEITNPSLETATTGYTAGAGSLARSTAQQYYGSYSAAYTPSAATTDGFYYTMTSTVALRAVSCKFLGQKGVPYALAYASTAPAELVTYTFIASGRWQWIWLYVNETSATSRRIYFRKNGSASLATFYVDGVQSEVLTDASDTVSTYIDGDQLGLVPNQQPAAYYWTGTPHASTSVRSGLTRAGGEVKRFSDYGFTLMAIVGLGLATPQNVSTEYARLDGGYDDYTRKPTRQFSLVGRFDGRSYAELRANRGGLADLFDRDLIAQDQRLLLMHRIENDCGIVQSNDSRLYCKYQGGLSGNTDGHVAEQTTITFTQYLPNILSDAQGGASLSVQSSLSNADYFLKRTPAGVWSVPGGGTGSATTMIEGLDGTIYIAGTFNNWNGNGSSDNIVKYDPVAGTYSPLSTGTNGSVLALALLPDGKVVLGGAFTSAGGVANTVRIAVYNPATDAFTALGTGASSNQVYSLAVDATGGIYAGGDYALMGGVANTVEIAYWNGSAWTALGTGANGTVYGLTIGLDRNLYLTGTFTTLNGVSCNQIGKWNGSAFSALSSGVNGSGGRALATAPNGLIYVGGLFTAAGGISGTNRIAQWNGVAFQSMGGGLGGDVSDLSVDPQGVVLATGSFAAPVGGPGFPDGVARYNGAAWTTIGIDTPAIGGQINAGLLARDGSLYMAYSGTGTAVVEAVTTITNVGTARSYPTIVINGPSSGTARIYSILNYTTNRAIYLNLTINAGEVVTLVFTPDALSFTSTFAGNIAGQILPGSNAADFFLQPGANNLAFFSASSTVTATLSYRAAYVSLDDIP